MSETPLEGSPKSSEAPSLLGPVNSVMQNIFDVVAEQETDPDADAEGGAPVDGTPPAGEGTPVGTEATPEPGVSGEAGTPAGEPAGAPATPGAPVRAPRNADTAKYAEQLSKAGEALEYRVVEHYRSEALGEYEEDYGHYISQLRKHPLELVGVELPPLSEDGEDVVFSTAAEVRDWQEAVKAVLGRGIQGRISELRDQDDEVLSIVHSSIELFHNNPDLIPKTKVFNKDLADRVAQLVKPYELRMNGKLTGYSIDIQGIVDQARGSGPAPAPAAAPAKKGGKKAAPPQGGIASKAGSSRAGDEDYTPMWNALGIDSMPV